MKWGKGIVTPATYGGDHVKKVLMQQMVERAKKIPKRVVYPESMEPRMLQAARKALDMGIARPILIGDEAELKKAAEQAGVSLVGVAMVNIQDEERQAGMASEYLTETGLLPEKTIKRYLHIPLYFGAMMVRQGDADAMVAGLVHTTEDVVLASQLIIGLQPGIEIPSSLCVLEIPGYEGSEGNAIVFSDCGVCPDPSAKELADIAITTAGTVRAILQWEPRIAMLSYSTKGSASPEQSAVAKVLNALAQVKERAPELCIDGELQLDAAIVPEVAAKKCGNDNPLGGKANILIFPNLSAGNVAYKAVQRFAKANAYGSYLQGFNKTVSDLSRGSSVDDILGVTTMAVLQAQYFAGEGLKKQ